jgi:hypothetical protein
MAIFLMPRAIFWAVQYGLNTFASQFTPPIGGADDISDLLSEARDKVLVAALGADLPDNAGAAKAQHAFGRQAVPMV